MHSSAIGVKQISADYAQLKHQFSQGRKVVQKNFTKRFSIFSAKFSQWGFLPRFVIEKKERSYSIRKAMTTWLYSHWANRGLKAAYSEKRLGLLSYKAQNLQNDRTFYPKQSYCSCVLIKRYLVGKWRPSVKGIFLFPCYGTNSTWFLKNSLRWSDMRKVGFILLWKPASKKIFILNYLSF